MILFISWIAAATGLFLFIRWLSRFLSTFKLPNDIRLLILMGFSGVMLVAALSFLWRQGAKDPDTPSKASSTRSQKPQTELDLDTYESTTYPELYGLRQEMRKQINDLQTFFGKITGWADAMPAQRPFLQTIIDIRWEQGKQLQQAYNVIDHSRRAFWLHYHTGEDKHVRTMFNDEAVRLQKRIQDALGDSREFQLAEADAIRVYLQKVDAILKEAKLPKPKAGQALSSVFMPYSDQNRQTLINVLTTKQEASVLANLNQLQQEEKHIRDKLAYMLQYQQVNTDLLTETNDLILAWNDALIYNQYAQYRLLFATEALETTQLLGVTPANRDYAWLLKELRELAPTILTQAQVERDIAAYSYNPDIVNAKQRKRLKPR